MLMDSSLAIAGAMASSVAGVGDTSVAAAPCSAFATSSLHTSSFSASPLGGGGGGGGGG
eukprot:CAMPEP_0174729836 /NCGR_PEP_ID=MMETSP1094-20130205/54430_1 /TAXON_ID=156173 /ORGANISM="Chrysochromulina brevifilum, Strain UTEX LB 985" /LENGTH=58 /DNA_ID=CAMNT_0015931999 /DNA_START=686 /DNA_END=858 /DNA_ORIENTATION=+